MSHLDFHLEVPKAPPPETQLVLVLFFAALQRCLNSWTQFCLNVILRELTWIGECLQSQTVCTTWVWSVSIIVLPDLITPCAAFSDMMTKFISWTLHFMASPINANTCTWPLWSSKYISNLSCKLTTHFAIITPPPLTSFPLIRGQNLFSFYRHWPLQ